MKVFIYDDKRKNGPNSLNATYIETTELSGYNLYAEIYCYAGKGDNTIIGDIFDVTTEQLALLTKEYELRGLKAQYSTKGLIFVSEFVFEGDKIDNDYLKHLEDLYRFEEMQKEYHAR
jgi:gamma-glutamylcyclotransferase (GGCT)/AIG2-like uncharacterized protein YtfP